MREATETDDAVISDALRLIDKSLSEPCTASFVSTDEVSDLLLDVRSLHHPGDATVDEGAPVGA